MLPIPSPFVEINDTNGKPSRFWYQWFASLIALPAPESAITVTASPFTYTAPDRGAVSVTGGTVSLIQVKRTLTNATGITAGVIPVGKGDQVIVTYSGLPTMVFLPI